eukprot:CAMPEP_0168313268 /NCGR_PEP_ID=MMETSP0210-20121227/728_1 /TAXON_ID=40633 /ORGANISM="Condylostoma magnum, Strain COL2" /LENGTH=40 /DNA_ID= /DNA_START= /DNA_END= /DNA_ORIENTATION=
MKKEAFTHWKLNNEAEFEQIMSNISSKSKNLQQVPIKKTA